jgi:hypothetical protein
VFFVEDFYADGEHARLASIFRTYTNGRHCVSIYKFPLAGLPADLAVRDVVRFDRRGFQKTTLPFLKIDAHRQRMLAFRRAFRASVLDESSDPLEAVNALLKPQA